MKNKLKSDCSICKDISILVKDRKIILEFAKSLNKVGTGRYYRGEEYQLSEFKLLQCTECQIYFGDAHHYYSDPQSTMGMARDEHDWFNLHRLSEDTAATGLSQLKLYK